MIAERRFSSINPWAAGLILAFVTALIAYGLLTPTRHVAAETHRPPRHQITDVQLYSQIIGGVRQGGGFYVVAADQLRTNHYPLKPFITFRQPLLDTMIARIGDRAATILLGSLGMAAILIWSIRLYRSLPLVPWGVGVFVITMTALSTAGPWMLVWHEVWAGYLIAIAIGLRTRRRWLPSAVLLLVAALIREFTLPVILLMLALAIVERRRAEAIGYAAIFIGALAALGWHAHQVGGVVLATDRTSPGWHGLQGWRFFLTMTRLSGPLEHYPSWIPAITTPLALLGWASWRSETGLRVALMLIGWACLFMLAARPDNFYWGMMLAPLLLTGLAFVPQALLDLARSASRLNRAREA
jgi:hypothetical protein